jgi:hypothetical protein
MANSNSGFQLLYFSIVIALSIMYFDIRANQLVVALIEDNFREEIFLQLIGCVVPLFSVLQFKKK